MVLLQSLSLPSQISVAWGLVFASVSSQSPAHTRTPSKSASASLAGSVPSQLLSKPSQISVTVVPPTTAVNPGYMAAFVSSQSSVPSVVPSLSDCPSPSRSTHVSQVRTS